MIFTIVTKRDKLFKATKRHKTDSLVALTSGYITITVNAFNLLKVSQ